MVVQSINSANELNFDKEVEWSVDALLKVYGAHDKKKLFEIGELIFLQACVFKIPKCYEMVNRRIVMKHPIRSDEPEVCLIVSDYIKWDGLKRTSDEMIDLTVEKYGELLEKHKIKGISKIMPFRQLRTEYDTYELRRKLVNQFDVFLCQNRVFKKDDIYNYLGKIFKAKNKFPITVTLPRFKDDFNQNANKYIQNAISSTTFYIKPSSDNYSIRIGNTLHKKEHLVENLKIVMNKLLTDKSVIPGGFENIRSLGIKTERSKIVPIYINMKSKNDVSLPKLKLNVKMNRAVKGEISTQPGKEVTVLPTGQVLVRSLKKGSKKRFNLDFGKGSDGDEGKNKKDNVIGGDELVSSIGNYEKSKKSINKYTKQEKNVAVSKEQDDENDDEDEDEDDDDDMDEDATDSAEQKYLRNLSFSEMSEDEQKEEKPNKAVQGRKRKVTSKPKETKKPKKDKSKELITKKLTKKKVKR